MKMKKMAALLFAVLLMLTMCISATADAKKVNEARNGVVYLYQFTTLNGEIVDKKTGGGTAFFVGKPNENPQYLVTCEHCVHNYLTLGRGEEYSVEGEGTYLTGLRVFFDNNDYVEAYVVEANEPLDVAILRLEKPTDKRKALKLKVPNDEMVSEPVYAIGFPYSAEVKNAVTTMGINDLSVTSGTISRLITNSNFGRREIQMETKITHGNSGGPLVNEKGSVIGVNANSVMLTDTYENYAVNIEEVIDILKIRQIPYVLEETFPVGAVVVMGIVILILIVLISILIFNKNKKVETRVLVGEKGVLAGKKFELKRGQKIAIGRNAECQVRFPADTTGVSKLHCTVLYDGEKVIVRDENSSAGTYVDQNKLNPGTSVTLHRGHALYIGSKAQMLVLRSKN